MQASTDTNAAAATGPAARAAPAWRQSGGTATAGGSVPSSRHVPALLWWPWSSVAASALQSGLCFQKGILPANTAESPVVRMSFVQCCSLFVVLPGLVVALLWWLYHARGA